MVLESMTRGKAAITRALRGQHDPAWHTPWFKNPPIILVLALGSLEN